MRIHLVALSLLYTVLIYHCSFFHHKVSHRILANVIVHLAVPYLTFVLPSQGLVTGVEVVVIVVAIVVVGGRGVQGSGCLIPSGLVFLGPVPLEVTTLKTDREDQIEITKYSSCLPVSLPGDAGKNVRKCGKCK